MKKSKKSLAIGSLLVIGVLLLSSLAVADEYDDVKITVMLMQNPDSLQGEDSFSLDICSQILSLENVEEVVPSVTWIVTGSEMGQDIDGDFPGSHPGGFPDGNVSGFPPNGPPNGDFSDSPGGGPGGFPDDGLRDPSMGFQRIVVEGIDLEVLDGYEFYESPADIIEGNMLTSGSSSSVILGEDAQEYFNCSVGDLISIDEMEFTVVGIFSSESSNSLVYTDIESARALASLEENQINSLHVYVDEKDSVSNVSSSIEEIVPNAVIQTSLSNAGFSPMNSNNPTGGFDKDSSGKTSNSEMSEIPGFEFVLLCAATVVVLGIGFLQKRRK